MVPQLTVHISKKSEVREFMELTELTADILINSFSVSDDEDTKISPTIQLNVLFNKTHLAHSFE